jgi:transcriptional regulator with XRE-family HTH domain
MISSAAISTNLRLPRPSLRCPHCRLVQFVTLSGECRKCHKPLQPPADELPATPSEPAAVAAKPLDPVALLPKRIRGLRDLRGWSQSQLAARMDVPRTHISKLENGKASPSLRSIARLGAALDVPFHHFFTTEQLPVMGPFLAEMAPFVSKLTDIERRTLLDAARRMAEDRKAAA